MADKTDRLLRSMRQQNHKVTPIATDMIIPNHSGVKNHPELKFTQGSVIFAGAGGVITQDNANLFFDDTNNRLGIGTTSPQTPVHILQSGTAGTPTASGETTLTIQNNGSTRTRVAIIGDAFSQIFFGDAADENVGQINYGHTVNQMDFIAGASPFPSISITSGECIVNDSQQDKNFRVESDTTDDLLFCDAGTVRVGIGTRTPIATLEINGGFATAIVAKIANYTTTVNDHTITCGAGNESFTVTLIAASGLAGLMYHIKNVGTGTITVDGNSAETIDGSATAVISTQFASISIQCDGSNWHII